LQLIDQYTDNIIRIINKIKDNQSDNIEKAAEIMAEKIKNRHMIHIVGTGGHSSMPVLEVLCRMGGPANINPVYDPGITGSHGLYKAIYGSEVIYGYAETIIKTNRFKKEDLLVITSAFGANVVTIELAMQAKKMGMYIIAITSPNFSQSVSTNHPVRHANKKNLYEIADLVINTYVPPGDCVVELEGLEGKIMQVSSIVQIFTINNLVGYMYAKLLDKGIEPERWISALADGADKRNKELYKKYGGIVKSL